MYGIGHVLSKNVLHETLKNSMEQSFKTGYMIKLDKTFEFHETKFHRVVWALDIKEYVMVRYAIYLIFVFIVINENIRNKRKIVKKNKGCT